MLGDFNTVLNLRGSIGSLVTLDEVGHFKDCVRGCLIHDHPSIGPFSLGRINKRMKVGYSRR